MAGQTGVDLPIVDEHESVLGHLRISALPSNAPQQTIFERDEFEVGRDEFEDVRLNEGTEYLYAIELPNHNGAIATDHPELFIADTERGDRGRLRTGLFTGAVEVQFFANGRAVGQTSFEVLSTKLTYLTDYQWMLRDISNICTDLIMEKFAPAEGRFSIQDQGDSGTLYQQFTFLKSILDGDEFQSSMRQILASPHVTWQDAEETASPTRFLRPNSRVARNVSHPGPRWTVDLALTEHLESLPQRMKALRATPSVDNVPNQFVKWLLQEWLGLSLRVDAALGHSRENKAFVRRGRYAVKKAIRMLEMTLDEDLFQDVQELPMFPQGNQVLQRREEYRYLFRSHLQFDVAAKMYWPGLDPVYRAGRRNVAQLYEYWVYLQLGRIIAGLCGQAFDATQLIETSPDGLTLRLRVGAETVMNGHTTRYGRLLRLECWFNKSFGAPNFSGEGSWTRPLRPDCSLRVEVSGHDGSAHVTWVHFDAKYRLEKLEESLDDDRDEVTERKRFRRDDLLKMHAYKDAIKKSAGAYIVYPGTEKGEPFRQYHELLPGLGAFALRPVNTGDSYGSETLQRFIEDVLEHLSLQTTQYSRARYWTARSYSEGSTKVACPDVRSLDRPPADVLTLLGYVKNAHHRDWVRLTSLYNVRADPERQGAVGLSGPEIGACLLVVYGPDQNEVELYEIAGDPRITTGRSLASLNYPEPRGNLYLCFPLKRLDYDRSTRPLSRQLVEAVRHQKNATLPPGAPTVVTWLDLCLGARAQSG